MFLDLQVTRLWQTGKSISNIYDAAALSKKLKTFAAVHCSNLSLVGSQLTVLNSFIPICALLLRFKQNLIHLFLIHSSESDAFTHNYEIVSNSLLTAKIKGSRMR